MTHALIVVCARDPNAQDELSVVCNPAYWTDMSPIASQARELSENQPGSSKSPFSSARNPCSCSRADRHLVALLKVLALFVLGYCICYFGEGWVSRGSCALLFHEAPGCCPLFKFTLSVLVKDTGTDQAGLKQQTFLEWQVRSEGFPALIHFS